MDHEQPLCPDQNPPAVSISSIQRTTIQILTASYGPAEGRRLLDGTLVDYSNRESFAPYTRDVIPFLAALASNDYNVKNQIAGGPCFDLVNKNAVGLMDGRSMNSVFGDPCPGTTKLLRVEYIFRDYYWSADSSGAINNSNEKRELLCTKSRVYHSTFAEHNRVLLKRQDALFRLAANLQYDHEEIESAKVTDNRKDEISKEQPEVTIYTEEPESTPEVSQLSNPRNNSSPPLKRFQSPRPPTTISRSSAQNALEITLRIVLPYLTVHERGKCQLVCSSWRYIVIDIGIAVTVDVNDTTLFPKEVTKANTSKSKITSLSPFVPSSPAVTNIDKEQDKSSTRALLRGLLTHSHSSLESLVINDYMPLRPALDLHPTLPYLRKLKGLDISRIPTITDETLTLISTFIGTRLEVLYMKGLRNVSNAGVVNLVQSCNNLRVLDVSYLNQLEDEAGIAIGNHLSKLEVFHARDNYKWTNKSVNVITANCKHLVQMTLWGCIRINHVSFGERVNTSSFEMNGSIAPQITNPSHTKILLLNLWGCHGLQNSSAAPLSLLKHLRSLCVSECHKLSDPFAIGIAQSLHQLLHIQLRYLPRITDTSIDAISALLPNLYSLDLSFCTQLTISAITKLLRERSNSLAELRLYSCRQLNLEGGTRMSNETNRGISSGRRVTQALASVRETSILSTIDLRKCEEQEPLVRDELFLLDMSNLGFVEEMHGFFRRPARWSEGVMKRLAETLN